MRRRLIRFTRRLLYLDCTCPAPRPVHDRDHHKGCAHPLRPTTAEHIEASRQARARAQQEREAMRRIDFRGKS